MATIHGGESGLVEDLVAEREAVMKRYGAVLAGAVILLALYDMRLAVLVLVAGIVLAGQRHSRTRRFHDAASGAEAELETARMLALLPSGFVVVNDLQFPGFNVDHVVVGPTGVWVIETKPYFGTFKEAGDEMLLDGRPSSRDPRAQARAGAAAVSGVLHRETGMRWWVEPLVCLPNATVQGGGREAIVVEGGQLLSRIRLAPVRLDGSHRDRIVEALGRRKGHALQHVA